MSIRHIFPVDDYDFHTNALIENLSEQHASVLFRHKVNQSYSKGDFVFREGNYASGIYWVEEGLVKKFKIDGLGNEQIFYIYAKGEIFGYHSILTGEKYMDNAVAISTAKINFVPRIDFLELLDVSPDFSKKLLRILCHEFDVLANTLSLNAQRSLRERLMITLINLREKFKPGDFKEGDEVKINITRTDLAAMLGTAKESVVRLMRNLKDEGLITTQGNTIQIIDAKILLNSVAY